MKVRLACIEDIAGIGKLLYQVNDVHACGRPDIFVKGVRKYTDDELKEIIFQQTMLVYVAVEDKQVLGYAFCMIEETRGNHLQPMRTLFIDDLCVDEEIRGKGIGKQLYAYVVKQAKQLNCQRITLNVWCLNERAMQFYQACGLEPLKIVMEQKL